MGGPKVHSTGEADMTIRDQDLPVVPQIDVRHPPGNERVEKTGEGHAAGSQPLHDRRPGVVLPRPVDQEPHLDPSAHRPLQRVHELSAPEIIAEYEGGEPDGAGGSLDRIEHGGIGGIPVPELRHRVARDQGEPGDAVEHLLECLPMVLRGNAGYLLTAAGDRGDRTLPRLPKYSGQALDPVDAKPDIEERTEKRHQPHQTHPPQRHARLPLVQEHVDADAEAQGERGAAKEEGPE